VIGWGAAGVQRPADHGIRWRILAGTTGGNRTRLWLVMTAFAWSSWGAPSRIRTCAHGSGGSWPTASLPARITVRAGGWSTSGPQVRQCPGTVRLRSAPRPHRLELVRDVQLAQCCSDDSSYGPDRTCQFELLRAAHSVASDPVSDLLFAKDAPESAVMNVSKDIDSTGSVTALIVAA
jgi:hypothetical protein